MSWFTIPTTYNGVRYRSRLEARWAVVFQQLGVQAHYEHEGFELKSGRYLPDFWLPDLQTWVEIKGAEPTDAEQRLGHDLATVTGKRVVLFFGDLANHFTKFFSGGSGYLLGAECGDAGEGPVWDCDYLPCLCRTCGRFGIEYGLKDDRICRGKCVVPYALAHLPPKTVAELQEVRLRRACEAAVKFSFWNPRGG